MLRHSAETFVVVLCWCATFAFDAQEAQHKFTAKYLVGKNFTFNEGMLYDVTGPKTTYRNFAKTTRVFEN